MNLKCYVIDDELYAAEMIANLINQTAGLELVGLETDDEIALKKLLNKEIEADIVFLDIELKKSNGVEFALKIKELTHIVFVTGDQKYAYAAIENDMPDYLLKPVRYERFLKIINNVRTVLEKKEIERKSADSIIITIRCERKIIFLKAAEVLYIESDSNYLKFHMSYDKMYMTYMSFAELEEQIHGSSLMRVHRGYMVNLSLVKSLDGNMIELPSENKVQLGKSYRDAFLKRLRVKGP